MERGCEEATQEPARGGARAVRRLGSERGQEARQQGKRPQRGFGQEPQEDDRCPAQRAPAAAWAPQEKVKAAMSSIQARFGKCAIGLGYLGIRYVPARHAVL